MSKISIPKTVEAQIRTRARNLPIHKCYVNKNWEKTQMATVLVVRMHSNRNITMGEFLVDLKLYGIKDCRYTFNESLLRLNEVIEDYSDVFEECDYNLAHNIIYAGLEFADDYGFEPHRNFKTAQYILEEDSDDIPMIKIPLGDDDIPVLEVPHGENRQREMTILDATANGNYHIVFLDENGNPKFEEPGYLEVLEEVLETGFDEYFSKKQKLETKTENQVFTDLVYSSKVFTKDELLRVEDEFEKIIKDPRLVLPYKDAENDYEEEYAQAFEYFREGKIEMARIESLMVISQHPDDPMLWDMLLYNLSINSDQVDEEAVNEAYSLFPDNPLIKAWYAEWLAQEDRIDEIFTLFGNRPGLDALTTESHHLTKDAIASFCFANAIAWINKKDFVRVEPYYQLIVRLDLNFRLSAFIQTIVTNFKHNKIEEMYKAGAFD